MLHIPFRRQQNDWYCGPACLQMVLGYFGIRKSQDALAKMAKTNKRTGTTRANLLKTLRRQKLIARQTEKLALADLHRKTADYIILINYPELSENIDHYALVKGFTSKSVLFNDPWYGATYHMPIRTFAKRWKSNAHKKKYPGWAVLIPKIQPNKS
jgi:ABC-type bacteriocin/lantibiotic exporter with double-glycine peptidase domain